MRSLIPLLLLAACSAGGEAAESSADSADQGSRAGRPFAVRPVATFNEPWAMAFLPGQGPKALITERSGKLKLLWNDVGSPGTELEFAL